MTTGWIVRVEDRVVAAGAAPMEAAERARRIGGGGVVRPVRDMGGRLPMAGDWREPRR